MSLTLTPADKRLTNILFHACLANQGPGLTFAQLDEFIRPLRSGGGLSTDDCRLIQARLYKYRGTQLHASGEYGPGRKEFVDGIRELLGRPSMELPSPDPYTEYMELDDMQMVDLAGLMYRIVLTYRKEGQILMALTWLEEIETLFHAQKLTKEPKKYDWMDYTVLSEEYVSVGAKARETASHIFESLRNTGTALAIGTRGTHLLTKDIFSYSPSLQTLEHRFLKNQLRLSKYRHPDPAFADQMHDNIEPTLQIKGSWKKLSIKNRISGRSAACVWIWSSRLYVFDGRNLAKAVLGYEDFSCLDLTAPESERQWRKLPSLPAPTNWKAPQAITGKVDGWDVVVHKDAAWIFIGTRELGKFNLAEERWEVVQTTLPTGTWPYDWKLNTHKMSLYKDTLYVFGGSSTEMGFGLDVFMALDLTTLKWRHISGTERPQVKRHSPGLREHGEVWIVPHEEKLYVMYGSALRQASTARRYREITSTEDYVYTDMWSFHIPTEKWKREVLRGNIPCARTEFSTTYNARLDKVFVFGGYSGSLQAFDVERGINFTFAYFADTFMWTPQTRIWAQVMTRGFPTARACSSLITDPDTGKIYLFGGYANTTYIDHGKTSQFAKAYSDVWQLCVDMPGGDWESVNLKEEGRLAALGMDSRCFNCGQIGRMRACGGSCKGKVSFCGKDCLVQAWPEHKQLHGCRK